MLFRFLITALVAASPASLAAQALTPVETAQVDALVDTALTDTGVPSASVAIVRGGRIVFTKAYGKQSERARAVEPRAPYQIASISKQFTAAAVLLLEDEGRLSLDDTVAKYIPGVTGGDRMTIRQLLSHTSGLRDYWPQDYSFRAMATPVTPQGIVERWAKAPLDFEPGAQWQYSNTGYVVAGMIVEKVAGQPLLAFLQHRIFKPLAIDAFDQDKAVGPGFPDGYTRFALGPVRVETPAATGWLYAAGELAMSAEDLAKWDVARLDRALLPADDWTAQETPVRLVDGTGTNYGLGVFASIRDGRRIVEHGGEAVGFLSENIVYPDDRAAVVVLVNAWFGDAHSRIATGIATALLPPAAADDDATALTTARAVFNALRGGALDRTMLTDDANGYFTATALADYRVSLDALGEPTAFVQTGRTRLRGGFVNRSYRATFATRAVSISTYAEPGGAHRYEQFLVTPAQ